jgi:hypothetical protein
MVLCVLTIIPLSAQQQNGSQQNSGAKPATTSDKPEVRTEKFKVKQEFGPQSSSRRSDQSTTVTPPSQGSGTQGTGAANNPNPQNEKFKQEFGPTQASKRIDQTDATGPQGQNGASDSQNSTGATSHQPSGPQVHGTHQQPSTTEDSSQPVFNPQATAGTQRNAGQNTGAQQNSSNATSSTGKRR